MHIKKTFNRHTLKVYTFLYQHVSFIDYMLPGNCRTENPLDFSDWMHYFHFFRRITCEKFQFANNYKKSRLFFSTSERCKWDCRKSESLYLHFSCFIRLIVMSRSAEDKIVWIFIMLYNFNWTFRKLLPPIEAIRTYLTWINSNRL